MDWKTLQNISEDPGVLPGAAMATLDMTTMVIPCLAAIKLCPTCLPSSVSSMIPSWSSSLLMRGMLTLIRRSTRQNSQQETL